MSNYLKINALKIENIRCYEKQEFSFINGNNTLLGENGSGKSTILLSIGVGLFGSAYLKSMTVSDLINKSHKSGNITLEFETVQGKYRSIFNIREKKNEFKLYRLKDTGQLVELTTRTKETRERINSLIGRDLDADMFRNALSSPQGELTELIDLTPKKRKDAIQKILGLEKYQVLEKHMSNILKGIENEKSLYVRELSTRSETIEDPSEIEKEIDTKMGELKAKEKELEKVNFKLSALNKNLDGEMKRRDQYTDLKSKIEIVSKHLQDAKNQREKLLPLVSKSCEKLGIDMNLDAVEKYRTDIQNQWDSILKEIGEITSKLENLHDNIAKKKKREKVLEQQELDLDRAEKAISELLEGKTLKEMQKASEEKTKQLHNLEKTILLKKNKLENTKLKIESDTKSLNELNTKLKTISAKFLKIFKKEITSLPEVHKQLSERSEKFRTERGSTEVELKKLMNQKTEFETKKSTITKTIDLLENSAETENCPTCRQKLDGINLSEVLRDHRNNKKDLKEKIKELDTLVDEYKKKEMELKRKIEKLEKELREINKFDLDEYNEMTAKREELKEQITKSTEIKVQLEGERKNLVVTKETKEKEIETVRKTIQEAEKLEKTIQDLKSNVKHIKEEIGAIDKEIDTIDEKSLREEMAEVKKRKDIVKSNRATSNMLSTQMSEFIDDSDQITQRKKELAGYNAQISRIELMSDEEFDKINSDVSSTQKLIGEISAEKKNLKDEVIPELKVKLKKVKEDVQSIESLRAKIERYEKGYKIYKVLEGIFKKLPDRLLVNISESVSNVMTDRMQTMFPNRMISRAVLDPEGNISLHQGGQLIDPRLISGGEKAALGLALRIALMRHVAPLEFMILDEPTNHLDTQRINEFLSIIQDNAIFTSSAGQLLLVTHREEFEKVADRIINIKIKGSGNRSVDIQ